jgi:prepilin-type N-terminal cleavage/methylation domain-containing protein
MMRKNVQTRGFTLFELLVVLSVMSVVTTIGVTAYSRVTGVWRVSAMRMELGSTADAIFESIRRDLENVASSRRTGQVIQGIDVLSEDAMFGRVPLDNDRIVLPIVQVGVKGTTERLAIRYHVRRDGVPDQLMRTLGPMDGSEPNGASQIIANNVLALDIEYLSDGTWKPAWSGATQPEAVKVHLTLSGAGQWRTEQITRSAVFPVYVQ